MTALSLRPATVADVPALARLGRDSFVAKFGSLYRAEDLATFLEEAYSEAAIATELADPSRRFQLAERDGALAAYCKLSLTCSFPEYARGQHVVELKQLYTAPGETGGGIGTALMNWAMSVAVVHGADEMQLSVYSDNHDAQRFYARYGFNKVADVTFKVGNHIDEEFLFARML
ncbi:MAG: GNAT family N-acetyltransferase [Novosphingobium sp.]